MALEVSALMGLGDKEEWERAGLFKTIDELSGKIGGGGRTKDSLLYEAKTHLPPLVEQAKVTNPGVLVTGKTTQSHSLDTGEGSGQLHNVSAGDTSTKEGPSYSSVCLKDKPTSWNSQRDSLKVKEAHIKKIVRVWKPKRQRRRLVIGMDVGLEETCQLSLCALVGRFSYKTRCTTTFREWMHSHWLPICGYLPEFHTLTFGWFAIVFKAPEDVEQIMKSFWDYEGGNLMLKRWRMGFDPATDYFSHRHVWVLLPDFH
jgi:hypothetical protein